MLQLVCRNYLEGFLHFFFGIFCFVLFSLLHSLNIPNISLSCHLRYNPELSVLQPPRFPQLPILLRLVGWRMHHLLRECGGHGPLRLWTHVSLLRLWPQTQEDGQCVLPHLQEDNQRYHQDLPEHVGLCWTVCHVVTFNSRGCQSHLILCKDGKPRLFVCAIWLRYSRTPSLKRFIDVMFIENSLESSVSPYYDVSLKTQQMD